MVGELCLRRNSYEVVEELTLESEMDRMQYESNRLRSNALPNFRRPAYNDAEFRFETSFYPRFFLNACSATVNLARNGEILR